MSCIQLKSWVLTDGEGFRPSVCIYSFEVYGKKISIEISPRHKEEMGELETIKFAFGRAIQYITKDDLNDSTISKTL